MGTFYLSYTLGNFYFSCIPVGLSSFHCLGCIYFLSCLHARRDISPLHNFHRRRRRRPSRSPSPPHRNHYHHDHGNDDEDVDEDDNDGDQFHL